MPPTPKNLVLLGVFGAAHGLKGEVRLKSYTKEPLAIADYGPLATKSGRVIRLAGLRPLKDDLLIARVEGVNDRNGAEALVNLQLFAEREALGTPEDEDEFFHADLVGLLARREDGTVIGTVTALFDFGAGDIVEVTPAGTGAKPWLLPFTRQIVPQVDVKAGHILVVLPEEIDTESEDPTGKTDER
ncbi:ribosome maturation factor RimM [Labrys monachus]|uniref:Ribosome maturation factor RimM n=1 Tax=Labrys monachus TaxID=217067 RepID=A0ABU0FNF2_9HYPH|nr:ribosome maturation factor RimM [Labrys monachus]MDQ0396142.1 16S rRNA processing protein RimM [Labrys monachus]